MLYLFKLILDCKDSEEVLKRQSLSKAMFNRKTIKRGEFSFFGGFLKNLEITTKIRSFRVDKQKIMGLSFHYKGKLKKPQSLKKLIEEVTDICIANKWKFTILDEDFPNDTFTTEPNKNKAYGICFTPPKCETNILDLPPSKR